LVDRGLPTSNNFILLVERIQVRLLLEGTIRDHLTRGQPEMCHLSHTIESSYLIMKRIGRTMTLTRTPDQFHAVSIWYITCPFAEMYVCPDNTYITS
jgi:hypothetical protein